MTVGAPNREEIDALAHGMPEAEARALLDRLQREDAHRQAHPLAYARLWDSESTSQRRAGQALGDVATGIFGGNGSGKTYMGAQFAVAMLLGRNHPDVRAWIEANGIDASRIPPDGGLVIASSLNSALSIDVQRRVVAQYLPPGCTWRNEQGPGVSSVTYGQHKIVFLTNDAGRRAVQGYAAALVWQDEEHDRQVFDESLQRVSRVRWKGTDGSKQSGWILKTMTPLKGLTWVYERFVDEPQDGYGSHWLHGLDNPYLDREAQERILSGYGQHERAAREKGAFVAMEGRVYEFERHLHVVPAFEPPPEWLRFVGWDFGTRNPTGIVWLAHDPSDDVLHVYREHYVSEQPLSYHAAQYEKSTRHEVELIFADSASRGERMSLAQEYEISTQPAPKGPGSVRAGINVVAARLAPVAGKVGLVVHDSCPALIREFEQYRWATSKTKQDLPDAPLKKDDHLMDALRYAVHGATKRGYW